MASSNNPAQVAATGQQPSNQWTPVVDASADDHRIAVCLMIDKLNVAGTERQLLHLIDQIDQNKVRPYLCLLNGTDPESRALEPTCCPVLHLDVPKIKSVHALRSVFRFARFLRRHQIQILQPYFPDSTFFAFIAARISGIKHFVRNRRNLGYNQTNSERWLGKLYSRTNAKTAVNSEACKQAIIEQESAHPESIVVIPNGVDLDPYIALDLPRLQFDAPTIGMLANLRPVKDPMSLLTAAIELSKEFPKLRLMFAGEGSMREELIGKIETSGLQDRFRLLGSVENVAAFLEDIDVAVLTSTSEGLSNSVIEYMAAARPIVATNIGGNTELIAHEVHGLLVEPKQPTQLAVAIRRMLSDRELALRCGTNARKRAIKNYGLRRQAERFEKLWADLVLQS